MDRTALLLDAETFDNGRLEGWYIDERRYRIFEGLYYSNERGEWLARFSSSDTNARDDGLPWNYARTLLCFHQTVAFGIKPTQIAKALASFHAKFDQEVKALHYPIDP